MAQAGNNLHPFDMGVVPVQGVRRAVPARRPRAFALRNRSKFR